MKTRSLYLTWSWNVAYDTESWRTNRQTDGRSVGKNYRSWYARNEQANSSINIQDLFLLRSNVELERLIGFAVGRYLLTAGVNILWVNDVVGFRKWACLRRLTSKTPPPFLPTYDCGRSHRGGGIWHRIAAYKFLPLVRIRWIVAATRSRCPQRPAVRRPYRSATTRSNGRSAKATLPSWSWPHTSSPKQR